MKRLLELWAVLIAGAIVVYGGSAFALDDGEGTQSTAVAGGFQVAGLSHVASGHEDVEAVSSPPGHWVSNVVCAFGGSATCLDVQPCMDGTPMVEWTFVLDSGEVSSRYFYCPGNAPVAQPAITNALVLRALRRVDLPASALSVQPGDGRTLVNFETNFFTDQGEFTRVVRLLGRRVELRIWPSRFVWRFGDGAELGSESAGSPYPDLVITHAYGRAGWGAPAGGHDLRRPVPGRRWPLARCERDGDDPGCVGAVAGGHGESGAGRLPLRQPSRAESGRAATGARH